MAGYSTINAQFRPMSYQEMLAPVVVADTEHKAIEEQQSQLNVLASQWEEKLAKEAPGSKVRSMYQNYVNDLKSQADLLSQNGLTSTSRKALSDMKARYTSDIVPIEEAYKLRAARAEEQRQLQLRDPSYLIERNLGEASIQEFMDNPNLSSKGISGAYITKIVADGATALAKQMKDNPRKWRSILKGQQYETLMQKGFSTEEVLKAIQANPNAAPELTVLVENAMNMSGIKDWQNNQDVINKGYQFARQGLYNAIGDTQYQLVKNEDYLNPLEQANLNAITAPPESPTSYATTHAHFDVNQHDKDFINLKTKLFANGYTTPLAKGFDVKGGSPITKYNKVVEHNKQIQAKIDALTGSTNKHSPFSSYGSGYSDIGRAASATNKDNNRHAKIKALKSQLQALPFSESEYKFMKQLGITEKDSFKEVRQKMSDYESNKSHIYTGYDLNITDYEYLSKQLQANIRDYSTFDRDGGSKALTLLDSKFNKIDATGSKKARWGRTDAFTAEDVTPENIESVQYIPKAGGLVIFTKNDKKLLINKGGIKDQLDFASEGSEYNKIINNYIARGNKPTRYIADDKGTIVEGTGYEAAQATIQMLVNAVIPQITHSQNPVQPKTNSNPFGYKP